MHRSKSEGKETGYHDDFRLSVILNYLFMVMIPFLILMAVFLIYFTWSATNSYGESTGKLIESEQKRLNALSQSYVNSSMFLYYGDQLESMGRSSSIDGKLESALKETMERQLSGQIDVDEMIIRYGKTVITAGQKYEISEEEIAQYDEVLERAGGKPVWITAIRTRPKSGSGYRLVLGRSLNSSEHRNVGRLYLLVDINAMANIIGNLTEKDGVTYAFQCKCYDKPIGVKAVQEVYAGRDYYDRMVGVVMTNQYFTQPAVELARKLNIMLWDRGYLDDMDKAE